jgi:hypothetical protein
MRSSFLSVRSRLLAAFGMIVLLMLAVGAFAIARLETGDQHVGRLASVVVPSTRAVGDINALMNKYRKDQLHYIVASPADRPAGVPGSISDDLSGDLSLMQSSLRAFRTTGLIEDPTDLRLLGTFQSDFTRYVALTAGFRALADKGRFLDAAGVIGNGPGDHEWDAVKRAIAAWNGHKVETARVAASASRSSYHQSVNLILAVLAVAIALVLCAALYSLRLVARVNVLERLRSAIGVLRQVANDLQTSSRDSSTVASEQSAAVAETSTTMEELAVTAGSISDNARLVADTAGQTGETMRDMQEKVDAIAKRSLSLGERSQEIGEILELITAIAQQTNLLALNAAIEAARAGDAGRGFAVVASEVRKLAERSISSSDSIRQIIGSVQNEANATILATEQGARQAREVGELMDTTASMLDESILATQQQRSAAGQVAEAMIQIREAADKLAADQTQRDDTSRRLEDLITDLEQTVAGGSDRRIVSHVPWPVA